MTKPLQLLIKLIIDLEHESLELHLHVTVIETVYSTIKYLSTLTRSMSLSASRICMSRHFRLKDQSIRVNALALMKMHISLIFQ